MPDYLPWRSLPGILPGIPALLYSADFTAESYRVQVTDLANVWVENLDRKPIIKRGLVEDTSIDPTDGPDQLRKMIQLIRAAFDVNDPEHPNTTLSIGREKDDTLLFTVTCVLPKPLKPFKWPMHLTKQPPAAIATQMVIPLVASYEARIREIDQLAAALREKDAVITRLVDKLEATGLGLERIFSALSGKRRLDRATAERKIKGLAPFSEAEFRREAREAQVSEATDVSSLLDSIFGGEGLSCKVNEGLDTSSALSDWWSSLGKGKPAVLVERPRSGEHGTQSTTETVREQSGHDDDDFEAQSTPPGLSSAREDGTIARPHVNDDNTSDGEDDAEMLGDASAAKPEHPVRPSGSRLGALGTHKQPQRQPSPSARMTPPRQTSARKKRATGSAASETESDDDGNNFRESPPLPSPSKPVQRRGGLGRIGGKPKGLADSAGTTSPTTSPRADTTPRKHKLGTIGKQPEEADLLRPPSGGEALRGRSRSPGDRIKEEPPRETSQERADRKRAELQRELQKKAAAGPAKKKRKF